MQIISGSPGVVVRYQTEGVREGRESRRGGGGRVEGTNERGAGRKKKELKGAL